MKLFRDYHKTHELSEEQWKMVKTLGKRVIFCAYIQSVCAILGALSAFIAMYCLELPESSPWTPYFIILFLALFLLPGVALAVFISRLQWMLGEGMEKLLWLVQSFFKASIPGWGIIIAFDANETINRHCPFRENDQ